MIREDAIKTLNTLLPDVSASRMHEFFEAQNKDDLHDIEREADHVAATAAAISAYLEARHTAGCGDKGHDAAMRDAEKARRGVRKTLGYTVP